MLVVYCPSNRLRNTKQAFPATSLSPLVFRLLFLVGMATHEYSRLSRFQRGLLVLTWTAHGTLQTNVASMMENRFYDEPVNNNNDNFTLSDRTFNHKCTTTYRLRSNVPSRHFQIGTSLSPNTDLAVRATYILAPNVPHRKKYGTFSRDHPFKNSGQIPIRLKTKQRAVSNETSQRAAAGVKGGKYFRATSYGTAPLIKQSRRQITWQTKDRMHEPTNMARTPCGPLSSPSKGAGTGANKRDRERTTRHLSRTQCTAVSTGWR